MATVMNMMAGLPLWVLVTVVFGASSIASWALVMLVRRLFPHPALKENNELVGFTYAVYGLIYGVILAFTIVTVWQQFDMAEATVVNETVILSELWRDAQGLPEAVRRPLQDDIQAYVEAVLAHEWHSMAHDGKAHPAAQAAYEEIWKNSYGIEPTRESEEVFLQEYLGRLNALSGARRTRLLLCRSELHAILWILLMFGALPTIAYPLLFAARHAWIHVGLTACITALVVLCLVLTFSLQYPFTGNVSIKRDAFEALRAALRERAALRDAQAGAESHLVRGVQQQ